MEEVNKAGAPLGSKNALKPKLWNDALRRAIAQDDGHRVRAAAESLLDNAAAGEQWAIRELADRLDGRPAQVVAGDDENPLTLYHRIERAIIDNAKD